MGKGVHRLSLACVLSILTTGCFWEGDSKSNGIRPNTQPDKAEGAVLGIITQWPQDQATQVDAGTSLAVQFDAALNPVSLQDGLTYLEERDTLRRVECDLRLDDSNRTLIIDPIQDLTLETEYVCHLSPLLNDLNQRLLEEDLFFNFKTEDATAPANTSFSIPDGSKNVSRQGVITINFNEAIRAESVTETNVFLRDSNNSNHPIRLDVEGEEIRCHLIHDLLPDSDYIITVVGGNNGVQDLAGNPLEETHESSFSTEVDNLNPTLVNTYPNSLNVSPNIQIILYFDESMDPSSVEATSFSFKGEFENFVPFDIEAEANLRTIRLVPTSPLVVNRHYTVNIHNGPGAITDLSGRTLQNSETIHLLVDNDVEPPSLINAAPSNDSSLVSFNAQPTLLFDQALDATRVNTDTITLAGPNGVREYSLALENNNTKLTLTPTEALPNGQRFTVTIKGGPMGIRDLTGNTLTDDITVNFTTGIDRTLPEMTISPTDGHAAVPPHATYTAAFAEALDPASVSASTVIVKDRFDQVIGGTILLTNENRIISFQATEDYTAGEWYTVTLLDGENGVRESTGTWLSEAVTTNFRIAFDDDTTPPTVSITINETDEERKHGLSVARSGFEFTVLAQDPTNYDIDLRSFEVVINGPASSLTTDKILAAATITKEGLRFLVEPQDKFAIGDYTVRARATDLAGNQGESDALNFKVVEFDSAVMPFEHTEVVWVRFDLDRDGNSRPDFEDDLLRLGLIAENDPNGTNQRMIEILRDGILSRTHMIFERKANGGRAGRDSVALMLTATQPHGIAYSQIAMGGLDPHGTQDRGYGQESTGILGRAFFDNKNVDRRDNNTLTSPGLGIFTGELFLFEVESHIALYPVFLTRFASRFIKLVPDMGGMSVGTNSLDPIVTGRNFDVDSATAPQVQRYLDIFSAADDWATATGVILAHEIGHSVGLVASGAPPEGLHGDYSLHNSHADLGNVMSSTVSYDAIISLEYHFRDINVAYLRQRLLMK